MRLKKKDLHELPNMEVVKSGTKLDSRLLTHTYIVQIVYTVLFCVFSIPPIPELAHATTAVKKRNGYTYSICCGYVGARCHCREAKQLSRAQLCATLQQLQYCHHHCVHANRKETSTQQKRKKERV